MVTREDNHRSLPVEQRSFLPEHPVSPLETNSEADAAWPDWQDYAQLGEAHLAQVESLSKPDERMEV